MYTALFSSYLAQLFSIPIYSYTKADQKCLQLMDSWKFETKANSRLQKHRCSKCFEEDLFHTYIVYKIDFSQSSAHHVNFLYRWIWSDDVEDVRKSTCEAHG